MPSPPIERISVCICTYRRAELLRRLLKALLHQDTGGLFEHSVVVVDNDQEGFCTADRGGLRKVVCAGCLVRRGAPAKHRLCAQQGHRHRRR